MSGVWLSTLSSLYKGASGLANFLYEKGILETKSVPVPVISVGNLTVGGTGKTPFTDYLVKNLLHRQVQVAVVSRAYRGRVTSPTLVDREQKHGALDYGDEPFLLAQRNLGLDVYVGTSKSDNALFAMTQKKYDVIVIDDGFQHRRLKRDLDIVLLDATEDIGAYQLLPLGRARESWPSLVRADVLVISKANLADPSKLEALLKRLPQGKTLVFADYKIHRIVDRFGQQVKQIGQDSEKSKVWLLSAIAKPKIFEAMVKDNFLISGHQVYRDHHQYQAGEIEALYKKAELQGCQLLLTEKDAIKLNQILPSHINYWVAPLEMELVAGVKELDEKLNQVFTRSMG